MKINLVLEPNSAPEKLAELAQLAESYGIAGIWTSNMHDARDPFVNFVDAARATNPGELIRTLPEGVALLGSVPYLRPSETRAPEALAEAVAPRAGRLFGGSAS